MFGFIIAATQLIDLDLIGNTFCELFYESKWNINYQVSAEYDLSTHGMNIFGHCKHWFIVFGSHNRV